MLKLAADVEKILDRVEGHFGAGGKADDTFLIHDEHAVEEGVVRIEEARR